MNSSCSSSDDSDSDREISYDVVAMCKFSTLFDVDSHELEPVPFRLLCTELTETLMSLYPPSSSHHLSKKAQVIPIVTVRRRKQRFSCSAPQHAVGPLLQRHVEACCVRLLQECPPSASCQAACARLLATAVQVGVPARGGIQQQGRGALSAMRHAFKQRQITLSRGRLPDTLTPPPELPRDALRLVFADLSPMDRLRCTLVCSQWRGAAADDDAWRKITHACAPYIDLPGSDADAWNVSGESLMLAPKCPLGVRGSACVPIVTILLLERTPFLSYLSRDLHGLVPTMADSAVA